MDLKKLYAPFDPAKVSWRVGSTNAEKTKGLALAYLDARDVMERLDEVCGPEGWQNTYTHAEKIVICAIGIKVGDEWVWKANGAGETDIEGEKGATSDAFKRAAVLWGIGRYLYDVKSPWVELEPMGKSQRIKDNQYAKLEALLKGKAVASTPPESPKQKDPKEARLAAENWVGQQQKVLVQLDADGIAKWKADNAGTLKRLEQGHKDLYDNLMDGVG